MFPTARDAGPFITVSTLLSSLQSVITSSNKILVYFTQIQKFTTSTAADTSLVPVLNIQLHGHRQPWQMPQESLWTSEDLLLRIYPLPFPPPRFVLPGPPFSIVCACVHVYMWSIDAHECVHVPVCRCQRDICRFDSTDSETGYPMTWNLLIGQAFCSACFQGSACLHCFSPGITNMHHRAQIFI